MPILQSRCGWTAHARRHRRRPLRNPRGPARRTGCRGRAAARRTARTTRELEGRVAFRYRVDGADESRARFYCDPTRHSPPTWAFIAYRRSSYGPGALLRRIRATRLCQGGVHMGILLERAFSVTFASPRGAQNGARSSRLGEPSGSKGQLEHLLLRSLSSSKGSIHSPPTGTEEVGRQMRDVGLPQRLRVRRSKGAVKLRLSRRPVPTVTGTKVSLLGSTRRRAGA